MTRVPGWAPATPPTLADVAELAGVSRQTVSNAVNNPDLLRPDTLTRVLEAIDELGYSPNRAARNLRTRASHLIGLRFAPAQEGTANALMDRFVHSLVETSSAAGYHVLLFPGDPEDPTAGYDELLRATAVDAFVATDTYLGNPQAAWLEARRAPFVAFGRPWDNAEAPAPVGRRRRRRRHRDRDRPPARPGPHPGRLDRLAQGAGDRRGPPRRLDPGDAHTRPLHHRPRLPLRGHRRTAAGRPAPYSSTRRSPPASSAPPTPSPWA